MQSQTLPNMFAFLLLCGTCLLVKEASAESARARLERTLFQSVDPGSTLVGSDGEPLTVTLEVALIDIVQADTTTNELSLIIWPQMTWQTPHRWSPSLYNNISSLQVSVDKLWIPDVVCYSLSAAPESLFPGIDALLSSDGTAVYVHGQRVRIICDLEGIDSDEGTECAMKYGSWTHTGYEIDLQLELNAIALYHYYDTSPGFEIMSTNATRTVQYYACCPEPYVTILYTLRLRTTRNWGSSLPDWF